MKNLTIVFLADIVITIIAIALKSWGLFGFCVVIAVIAYTLRQPINEFNK